MRIPYEIQLTEVCWLDCIITAPISVIPWEMRESISSVTTFFLKHFFLVKKKKLIFFRKPKGTGKVIAYTIIPRSGVGRRLLWLLPSGTQAHAAGSDHTCSSVLSSHLCCHEHFPKHDYFDLDVWSHSLGNILTKFRTYFPSLKPWILHAFFRKTTVNMDSLEHQECTFKIHSAVSLQWGGERHIQFKTSGSSAYDTKNPIIYWPISRRAQKRESSRLRSGSRAAMVHTGFQRASCRSLMRLKPVVKTLPSARKMALMGRAPSCAFSFSWVRKQRGTLHTDCRKEKWGRAGAQWTQLHPTCHSHQRLWLCVRTCVCTRARQYWPPPLPKGGGNRGTEGAGWGPSAGEQARQAWTERLSPSTSPCHQLQSSLCKNTWKGSAKHLFLKSMIIT